MKKAIFLFVVLTIPSIVDAVHCWSLDTNFDYGGPNNGEVQYLDRHTVKCTQYGVLKRVSLIRDETNGKINYDYDCCVGPQNGPAVEKTTGWVDLRDANGNPSIFRLAAFESLVCEGKQGLNGFKLEVYWDWGVPHGRYRYWCIETPRMINNYGYAIEDHKTEPYMDRSLESLTKVMIICPNMAPLIQVITMSSPGSGQFTYGVRCLPVR